ncbi:hypothetical protein Hanom_Chr06g00575561 [Helianthus anomalus]
MKSNGYSCSYFLFYFCYEIMYVELFHIVALRLWGMERGLERNAQVTTPGGLGFGRGPIGVGFSMGVGRGYPHDMVKPHWPRALITSPQLRPTIPL